MQASDWIAVCATIVAAVSLFVAAQQTSLTRRHNRLSVKPVLSMYRMEFKNKPIEYLLINRGLGPAIIKEFIVLLDDRLVDRNSGNLVYDLVDKLDIPRECVAGHLLCKNEPLSPGCEVSIMQFKGTENNEELHSRLVGILPRVKFRITYASIYEESFEYNGNGS